MFVIKWRYSGVCCRVSTVCLSLLVLLALLLSLLLLLLGLSSLHIYLSHLTETQRDARTHGLYMQRLGWEGWNHLCEAQEPERQDNLSLKPSSIHPPPWGPYFSQRGMVFTDGICTLLKSLLSMERSLRDITNGEGRVKNNIFYVSFVK